MTQPDLIDYSATQQDEMAKEIKGGSCPALNQAMIGYKINRDQSRAARK